jgi:predicted amidohydrolase
MNADDFFIVAAYQGTINENDSQANLDKIFAVTKYAETMKVDVLCFPETFLHGYFSSKSEAMQTAIDLRSIEFANLCKRLSCFHHTTILFGLNEKEEDKIYNTVVVIENGACLGKYRKAYTYVPYDYYSLGRDFPVFEKKGIKYGVIVCLDSVYREPAYITALKGARIIFCPSFNRIQKDVRLFNYLHSNNWFISRAFDNHCWFVTSDIIWDKGDEVSPGFTSIFNDEGEIVGKAEAFQEMVITYSIPLNILKENNKLRIMGNHDLFEIIKNTYQTIEEDKT